MRRIAGRNDVRSAVVFGNEVADGQAESSGQVVEPVDVHAGLAAFEFADEGPVEAGGVGSAGETGWTGRCRPTRDGSLPHFDVWQHHLGTSPRSRWRP